MSDMRRRQFITLLGGAAAAWPVVARAQRVDRVRQIGVLQGLAPTDPEYLRRVGAFGRSLQELGWSENKNIAIHSYHPEGQLDRVRAFAAELVHANVDVIVTAGGDAVHAAQQATHTIPIVMASVGDAVRAGIVASLARPGGNVTGMTLVATEMGTKRLELLKEVVPNLARVAAIWNGGNAGHRLQVDAADSAAQIFGIKLLSLPLKTSDDIEKSMLAAVQARSEALITMDDQVLVQFNRALIVDLATLHRLPVMGEFRLLTEAGALAELQPKSRRHVVAGCNLRGQDTQRRKACGLTCRATDELRVGHQPESRQGARDRDSAFSACARRRGHRMTMADDRLWHKASKLMA